jgi:hypothetical protein
VQPVYTEDELFHTVRGGRLIPGQGQLRNSLEQVLLESRD